MSSIYDGDHDPAIVFAVSLTRFRATVSSFRLSSSVALSASLGTDIGVPMAKTWSLQREQSASWKAAPASISLIQSLDFS
jgi:hypothetical protein